MLAALGAALLLALPSVFQRDAMGIGDVKLAGVLGLALGGKVLLALTLGSLATVPAALVILCRAVRRVRGATIPFGPFLAFGAAAALLLGGRGRGVRLRGRPGVREGRGGEPVRHAELAVDVAEVELHRLLGDPQLLADGLVGQARAPAP